MSTFQLTESDQGMLPNTSTWTVYVNGFWTQSMNDFYTIMANNFFFPSYFSKNPDSFYDCLNDLSWLNAKNYCLIIHNPNFFLRLESDSTKKLVFEMLGDTMSEWANVPNYDGEEEHREKADFQVKLFSSKELAAFLVEHGIDFIVI